MDILFEPDLIVFYTDAFLYGLRLYSDPKEEDL